MRRLLALTVACVIVNVSCAQTNVLVFQSDFGLKDGAVSAMKGVAFSVSKDLNMFDITHDIPAYNIWEGAYRLRQAAPYWPTGTVFVSVVDPGVGSERRSIVMKTKSGHYFVTPDNGTLTLVAESMGVEEVRIINEEKNRREDSRESYTFHGRDVYAYTGARLASGVIKFSDVGPIAGEPLVVIPYQKPVIQNNKVSGTIDILDIQYGNIWTNISKDLVLKLGIEVGDRVDVQILKGTEKRYDGTIPFGKTFADVKEGEAIAYLNSLLELSLAINQGSFSETFKISSGPEWRVIVAKHPD